MLADPTRRRLLDLLAERGELTVGELAAEFPDLVASGISKHLMGLRAAHLVTATKAGRTQRYRLDAATFSAALSPWVTRYRPYFDDALDRLQSLAESDAGPQPSEAAPHLRNWNPPDLPERPIMTKSFTRSDDLSGATFTQVELRGARFDGCTLADVVVRGGDASGMEIDDPLLLNEEGVLLVNGVNVLPFVDAELNRRFPGRELRQARTPDEFRSAWSAVEDTWASTLDRAADLPEGAVNASVGGEWSFAQTLRHLVMATDTWLGKAVLRRELPYHPIGQPNVEYELDGNDPSVFQTGTPPYAEVVAVRAERMGMVRDYLATVTTDELREERPNPHDERFAETVASCLRAIINEEWEHHRYAVRDLDALDSR